MGWFPVMLEFAGRHCLVAGGGATALRKTNDLLAAEAEVTVIAREMLPAFTGLAVRKLCRDVCAKDIDGMQLVVDATGDPSVGHMLAEACQARQIFFNAASDPQHSTVPGCTSSGTACGGVLHHRRQPNCSGLAARPHGGKPVCTLRGNSAANARIAQPGQGANSTAKSQGHLSALLFRPGNAAGPAFDRK